MKCSFSYIVSDVYIVQPLSLSIWGRISFVSLVVLLGGPYSCYAQPEHATAHANCFGCAVVVVVTFLGARHTGVVNANRMMAVHQAVTAHVARITESPSSLFPPP